MRGIGEARQRAQQRLGVGHARRMEDLARRRRFHGAAGIHDHDVVGAAGGHAEIVGDQDHRHAALALLALQQVEDLALHGDVERRGRLVGDQQLGRTGDGNGDGHALAHAAREFMRILGGAAFGLGNADLAQKLDGAAGRGLGIEPAVQAQPLADLAADLHHRIERGHRVLEYDADLAAQHAAEFPGRQGPKIAPLEQDLSRHLGARALAHQADQ